MDFALYKINILLNVLVFASNSERLLLLEGVHLSGRVRAADRG